MENRGGKRKGAGRKPKADEQGLISLIDAVWDKDRQKGVIEKLVEDCESIEFNVRQESRKLLLAYRFGKPTEPKQIFGEIGIRIIDESE